MLDLCLNSDLCQNIYKKKKNRICCFLLNLSKMCYDSFKLLFLDYQTVVFGFPNPFSEKEYLSKLLLG
jgi:hypothetical protein